LDRDSFISPVEQRRLGVNDRQSEHRDIAHPITPEFREYLQRKVLEAYGTLKSRTDVASPDDDLEQRIEML
jgi:DNA-binding cell septation regulator SpoVG